MFTYIACGITATVVFLITFFTTRWFYKSEYKNLIRSHRMNLESEFRKTWRSGRDEGEEFGRQQERLAALSRTYGSGSIK